MQILLGEFLPDGIPLAHNRRRIHGSCLVSPLLHGCPRPRRNGKRTLPQASTGKTWKGRSSKQSLGSNLGGFASRLREPFN